MPPTTRAALAVLTIVILQGLALNSLIQSLGLGQLAYSLLPGVLLAWTIGLFYLCSVLGLYDDTPEGETVID